jgi:hypothetical protein
LLDAAKREAADCQLNAPRMPSQEQHGQHREEGSMIRRCLAILSATLGLALAATAQGQSQTTLTLATVSTRRWW